MQTGKIELQAAGTLKDGAGSAGTSGQILSSTSTSTAWINPPSGSSTRCTTLRYQHQWGTYQDLSVVGNGQNMMYDANNQPTWAWGGLQGALSTYLGVWSNPHSISKITVAAWMSQFYNFTGSSISNGNTINMEVRIYEMLQAGNAVALVATVPLAFTIANIAQSGGSVLNNGNTNRSSETQRAIATLTGQSIVANKLMGVNIYCSNANFRPASDFVLDINYQE